MSKRQRPKSLIQGEMDGLCGVYALTHALLHSRKSNSDVLRARYFNGLLKYLFVDERFKPSRIRSGFNRRMLKSALEKVVGSDNALEVEVTGLYEFAKCKNERTVLDALSHLSDGETALLLAKDTRHWICGYKHKGVFKCYDSSSNKETRLKILNQDAVDEHKIGLSSGLAILKRQNDKAH